MTLKTDLYREELADAGLAPDGSDPWATPDFTARTSLPSASVPTKSGSTVFADAPSAGFGAIEAYFGNFVDLPRASAVSSTEGVKHVAEGAPQPVLITAPNPLRMERLLGRAAPAAPQSSDAVVAPASPANPAAPVGPTLPDFAPAAPQADPTTGGGATPAAPAAPVAPAVPTVPDGPAAPATPSQSGDAPGTPVAPAPGPVPNGTATTQDTTLDSGGNAGPIDGSSSAATDPAGGDGSDSIVAPSVSAAAGTPGLLTTVTGIAGSTATAAATTVKAGTTAAAAAVATPAWMNTLQNSAIAADMKAAVSNGSITYAGLEKTIANLVNQLATSKTTLSASQFADLKTIAANLNNGVSTSGYLTSVMNSLVNGSAQNATYTGGAATSTALGNLAAGATSTQLSQLNGKWLLGTDTPSSAVNVGGSKFNITYQNSTKPLFGAAGPSVNDVNQGALGDCYIEASLAEMAQQNPNAIKSMITDNGNNTYGVRFFVNGVATYETVNNALANGGTAFNSGPAIWASLVEKAYTQLQTSGTVANSYTTIGNGGDPLKALGVLTGATKIDDYVPSATGFTDYAINNKGGVTSVTSQTLSQTLNGIITHLAKGDDVVLTSMTNASSGGKTTLVASHEMSITGYNAQTGNLVVRNPWGTEVGQSWNTTFEVSLATLQKNGDYIQADNIGTKVAAPVLVTQTQDQTWARGTAISFTVPAGTFLDPQGTAMTYKATLSTGGALPSWLAFNAATQTFSGTEPTTATPFGITLTATDALGLSTSETFNVATPAAAAPKLTAQTANQTWTLGSAVSFTLAANTFTDPQGQKLSYTASQSSGAALPSWLTFNAATQTFSGTEPANATPLSIKVTATNSGGMSTSETFGVATTAASAPVLANQTANQVLTAGKATSVSLANAFRDPQGQTLTTTLTQSNGQALPSWMQYNAATGVLTENAPAGAAPVQLTLTAKNTAGLSKSETFSVSVTGTSTVRSAAPGSLSDPSSTQDPTDPSATVPVAAASGSTADPTASAPSTTAASSATATPIAASGTSTTTEGTSTSGASTSPSLAATAPASSSAGTTGTTADPAASTAPTQVAASGAGSISNSASQMAQAAADLSTGGTGAVTASQDQPAQSGSSTLAAASLSSSVSQMTQAIASTPSLDGAAMASLAQAAQANQSTLATPMH